MKLPFSASDVLSHALAYLVADYLKIMLAAGLGVAIALLPSKVGNAEVPKKLECPAPAIRPVYRI